MKNRLFSAVGDALRVIVNAIFGQDGTDDNVCHAGKIAQRDSTYGLKAGHHGPSRGGLDPDKS